MTTKYNVGDVLFVPFRIDGIRIDKNGTRYIVSVNPESIDDPETYFLDTPATISERNIEKLIERGFK